MSFQAMAWAVKQTPAGSKEKFVLLMLANYASNENGDCHPSLNEICDATMLSRDSVIRALKSLEEDGLISVEKKRVGRVNLPNTYTLNLRGVVAQGDYEGSRTVQGGSRKNDQPVVAHSDPNLSIEPIKAKPRERIDYDGVMDKLLQAAGLSGFREERSPSLMNLAPILGLLDAGFDLEREILPAIQAKAATGFVLRSWKLVPDIVREFAEKRRGAAATPRAAPKLIDWPARMEAFEQGIWPHAWGPKPGEPGCGAPAELLEATRAAA